MWKIEENGSGDVLVTVPMALRTQAGRRRIIIPGEGGRRRTDRTSPVLLAFARAYEWRRLLAEGHFGGVGHLAASLGVDGSYVRRILRLNEISPRIVRKFIAQDEPDGISLNALTGEIPVLWSEQEKMFGIR
ncbi:MAG: hypothetical protein ACI4WT_11660 [Oligosphaeraceae bacterium]